MIATATPQASLAQPNPFVLPKGKWIFTQYAHNILKVTFQPDGYVTNENISDAVVLKPAHKPHFFTSDVTNKKFDIDGIDIQILDNGLVIGNGQQVKMSGYHDTEPGSFKGFKFILEKNEKIFGGGERAITLDRRGHRFNMYNSPSYAYSEGAENLNYSVPFFTSTLGYALFFDNAARGYADIGKADKNVFEYGAFSGELNFFVLLGNHYKEILKAYHKLTGKQPLPPRWALGNFASRFGYVSQAQAQKIIAGMLEKNIPTDAIIFDLFWFGDSIKGTMGNLDWTNKKLWKNPEAMIESFAKKDIHTILITEPFVVKTAAHYEDSKAYHAVDSEGLPFLLTAFYFGEAGLLDIFRKDVQEWFWEKHKKQMEIGVAGWWGDLGEPERHPEGIYHNLISQGYTRLFKADEVHNMYGHTWTKMLYDHFAKDYPNKRLFSLNRSGFAGTQRYSIFPWTGDVSRSWSGLRAQLPVLLGMSMSGVPYVHSDAGGFAGGEGDNELYVRWLQFAAFTPIFRPHGTALYEKDPLAFSFPSEPSLITNPYIDYARKVVELRYKMLPYNYTLAYRQSTKGEPLIRPLYYEFENDKTAFAIEDEFMWGAAILVAPVLQPKVTSRKVYLPKAKWLDLNNNKLITGAKTIDFDVQNFKIPLFVKEGSFVPYYREVAHSTKAIINNAMELLYVPSIKASTYKLYNDDGEDKFALKNEKYEIIQFASSGQKKNTITIKVDSNGGNYPGKQLQKNILLNIPCINKKPSSLTINGVEQNINIEPEAKENRVGARWLQSECRLYIPIDFTGEEAEIQVSW